MARGLEAKLRFLCPRRALLGVLLIGATAALAACSGKGGLFGDTAPEYVVRKNSHRPWMGGCDQTVAGVPRQGCDARGIG